MDIYMNMRMCVYLLTMCGIYAYIVCDLFSSSNDILVNLKSNILFHGHILHHSDTPIRRSNTSMDLHV